MRAKGILSAPGVLAAATVLALALGPAGCTPPGRGPVRYVVPSPPLQSTDASPAGLSGPTPHDRAMARARYAAAAALDVEAQRLEELFTYQRLARGARQPSLLRDAKAFREGAVAALDEALAYDPGSPAILRRKGDILVQLGRLDEAVDLYRQADAAGLADPRWYFRAAGQLEVLNRLPDAARLMDVLANAPGGVASEEMRWIALLELGELRAKLEDYPAAEDAYRRALGVARVTPRQARTPAGAALATQMEQDPTGVRRLLVGVLTSEGKLDEALAEARAAMDDAPHDARALAAFLNVCKARGDKEGAVAAAEAFVDANPSDQVGMLALLDALGEAGRLDDAVARAREFMKGLRDDTRVRQAIVGMYQEAGRTEEAAEFARAKPSGGGEGRQLPAYPVALSLLDMYANGKDVAKAQALGEEILQKNAGELNMALEVLTRLYSTMTPEEFDAFCRGYTDKNPFDLRVLYGYGAILQSKGEDDRAGEVFVEVAEKGAQFGAAYQVAGAYLAGKGEAYRGASLFLEGVDNGFVAHPEGGVSEIVEATKDPAAVAEKLEGDADKYATAGQTLNEMIAGLYLEARRNDKAEEYYRKALSSPLPLLVDSAGLVLALYRQDKTPEAIATVERLMQGGQGAPPLLRMLAGMLAQDGRYEEAGELAERLIRSQPTDIDNRMALVSVYVEQGDYAAAERELRPAMDLAEGDAEATSRVRYMLGLVYDEQKKDDLAVAAWRENLAADPDDPDSNNALGYHFAERGANLDEAKTLVEKALAAEPANGAYLDSLGWVYYKMNDIPAAVETLRQAAAAEKDTTIFEHLGDALLEAGDKPGALDAWRKALDAKPKDKDRARVEDKIRENFPEGDL